MPGIDSPPENDQEFVRWYASSYFYEECTCDDCNRLRDILDLEVGEELDLSEHGININDNEDDETMTCAVCGDDGATHSMQNDAYACRDCWMMNAIAYCNSCDTFYHVTDRDSMPWYNGQSGGQTCVCKTCVDEGRVDSFFCAHCETSSPVTSDNNPTVVESGTTLCSSCARRQAVECRDCEILYYRQETEGSDLRGPRSFVCTLCIEEFYQMCDRCGDLGHMDEPFSCRCPDDGIWNYSYRPPNLMFLTGKMEPDYRGPRDDRLFLGVEVEAEAVECNRRDGSREVSSINYLYCKNDGSLERGFEIVSHPFTWNWYRENRPMFEDIFSYLRGCGFYSFDTETCGMHVHMSRSAFSRLHMLKFMKLVYDNPHFTKLISERHESLFKRWAGVNKENPNNMVAKARSGRNVDAGRHIAVNLNNGDTVELRIFRGTLDVTKFEKNLEYSLAAFYFTKTIGHKDVTVSNFLDWVVKHQKRYPYLYQFLVRKNKINS